MLKLVKPMAVALLMACASAHAAEPTQKSEDWMPQLDQNIAHVNALYQQQGKTGRFTREGYMIVFTDSWTGDEVRRYAPQMRNDPKRFERIQREEFVKLVCGSDFGGLLMLGLSFEARLLEPIRITTRLNPGDCK